MHPPTRIPAAPSRIVPASAMRAVPRSLAATLLPGEHVTFGSTPHPIVLLRPLGWLLTTIVAFAVAWQVTPAAYHAYVEARAAIAALTGAWTLLRNMGYYLGFRAVATNRRIFVIRGLLWRRVAPLGNGVLASSTLVQGVFGRMYGFGSNDVTQPGSRQPLFRDMREAGALYRECQAVANGVDGDTWTPAVRQTIIP